MDWLTRKITFKESFKMLSYKNIKWFLILHNLRENWACKCVLGIRDTIVLPLLQNPQKTLPHIRRVVTPRGPPTHPYPQGWKLEKEGLQKTEVWGHSVPQCKGIWVCLVMVSSSQNTEAHKDCATNTCSSHFQCQPVFPEVLFLNTSPERIS